MLHFFPGPKALIWAVDGKVVLRAEAWGGTPAIPGVAYDTMAPRQTTPGTYIVHSYAPYKTRTWMMSRIPWGTELMPDRTRGKVLYRTGSSSRQWADLDRVIPGMTLTELETIFLDSYGPNSIYDTNSDGLPDIWVFNDFGPMAVRYFKDKNKNRRLDKDESLSGEMIHTTPGYEAQKAKGETVTLDESHGCIHVGPFERDRFHKAGAFDKGVTLLVHTYAEEVPAALR